MSRVETKVKQEVALTRELEGTNFRSMTAAEKGIAAERVPHVSYRYMDHESLPCRLPSNKGIDSTWIKKTPEGTIKRIVVVESKFATRGGRPRLSKSGVGDKKVQQLSSPWLDKQMDAMKDIHPETHAILNQYKDKIFFEAHVVDGKGKNTWYNYGQYDPANRSIKAVEVRK